MEEHSPVTKIHEQITLHRVLTDFIFSDVEKMAAVFILTKTPLFIAMADSDSLELMNPAFASLHGYTVEELSGKPILEIFAPEIREQVTGYIKGVNVMEHLIFESRHIKKDGTVFPVQIDVTAIRDDQQNILFRIFTVFDITDRKRAEEQIYNLLEELRRTNDDLDQFSTMIAHDLKGPLATISGFARRLLKKHSDSLDSKAQEYLQIIEESGNRMLKLISELREYATTGKKAKDAVKVDIRQVIRHAVENLGSAVEAHKVAIRVDEVPSVKGDELQLVQLFQNLISNSINYRRADEPLTIQISSVRKGDDWVFRFKDNGMGIESSAFQKIFLSFQRGTHTGAGMGLGLAICKRILERHGGRIWVDSKTGRGSSFYFSLPAGD
jgi:PAS domain S-box-containing protein